MGVFQGPRRTPTRSRSPRRQPPCVRAMLVLAQVASMKTRRSGSRSMVMSATASRRPRMIPVRASIRPERRSPPSDPARGAPFLPGPCPPAPVGDAEDRWSRSRRQRECVCGDQGTALSTCRPASCAGKQDDPDAIRQVKHHSIQAARIMGVIVGGVCFGARREAPVRVCAGSTSARGHGGRCRS